MSSATKSRSQEVLLVNLSSKKAPKQDKRQKSPRETSTEDTTQPRTHHHHNHHHHQHHQQQQKQHLVTAADLLKTVAEKQLTGSSLPERLLISKLTALTANVNVPPTSAAQTAVCDTNKTSEPKIPEEKHHRRHHHQQQQHLVTAADLLKTVAGKQLTGSSLLERLLISKLTALPANVSVPPTSAAQTTVEVKHHQHQHHHQQHLVMAPDLLKMCKPPVSKTCCCKACNPTNEFPTVANCQNIVATDGKNTYDPTLPTVNEVANEGNSKQLIDIDHFQHAEPIKCPSTCESKDRKIHCHQPDIDSQDDSDFRTVR